MDRWQESDPNSEQSEGLSSERDLDAALESVASRFAHEQELCKERYARLDADEMPHSEDDRTTVEIGIRPNGTYHS